MLILQNFSPKLSSFAKKLSRRRRHRQICRITFEIKDSGPLNILNQRSTVSARSISKFSDIFFPSPQMRGNAVPLKNARGNAVPPENRAGNAVPPRSPSNPALACRSPSFSLNESLFHELDEQQFASNSKYIIQIYQNDSALANGVVFVICRLSIGPNSLLCLCIFHQNDDVNQITADDDETVLL